MRILLCMSVCVAVLSFQVPAQTGVTFGFATSFSTGTPPSGLASANVLGSSLDDILVANKTTDSLRILENLGPTQVPIAHDITVGIDPSDILVTDLDGDGDRDIVTLNQSDVSVLTKVGPASFMRADYALSSVGALSAEDLNGDGMKDLIRGGIAALATSPGVFGTVFPLPNVAGILAERGVGDFDGDGDVDVVSIHFVSSAWLATVHANDGSGNFSSAIVSALPSLLSSVASAPRLTVADWNADGIADLVMATMVTSNSLAGTVIVGAWLGSISGGFAALPPSGTNLDGAPTIDRPLVVDMNGDGLLDVFVRFNYPPVGGLANAWFNRTEFFLGTSAGGLARQQTVSQQTSSTSLFPNPGTRVFAVGDLDGDGDRDLVQQTGGFLPASNIDVYLASPSPLPNYAGLSLVLVGNSSFTIPAMTPNVTSARGFEVRVVDASGMPVTGVPVTADVILGTGVASFFLNSTADSDAAGNVTIAPVGDMVGGTAVVRLSLPNGASLLFNVDARPMNFQKVSGDAQTIVMVGHPPSPVAAPQPFVVRVTDPASGAGIPGVDVLFRELPNPSVTPILSPTFVTTDATGTASFNFVPQTTVPSYTAQALIGQSVPFVLTFNMTMNGSTIVPTGGIGQATDLGDPFFHPFEVQVVDAFGNPEAGIPVTFAPSTAGQAVILTPQPVVTDSMGFASTMAASAQAGNVIGIRATQTDSLQVGILNAFVRLLTMTGSSFAGSINVIYRHEHGPQALILAFDVPQPIGIPTPYGVVHTSITSPTPTIIAFDPQGLFGTADASLIANPNYTRSFVVPMSLAGFVLVSQVYGFDPAYYPSLPEAIFVSNAVVRTL